MRAIILAAAISMLACNAWADGPTCKSQAGDKKLAGAALTSFMKKCQTDAQTSCDASATDKKLFGAARSSFTKKCLSDAVGS